MIKLYTFFLLAILCSLQVRAQKTDTVNVKTLADNQQSVALDSQNNAT